MKIAVCFAGQLRTAKQCLSNILHYLRGVDVDFFIHTWDMPSKCGRLMFSMNECFSKPYESDDFQYVIDRLNPKSYLIEPQDTNIFSSYYHLEQSKFLVNKIRIEYQAATNVTYDMVLQIRFDMIYHPDRSLMDDIKQLQECSRDTVIVDRWIDNYSLSTEKIANKISHFFPLTKHELVHSSHKFFSEFCKENNVDVMFMDDRRFTFMRSTESIFDSLTQYYAICYANSITYSPLREHVVSHWQWHVNYRDDDWKNKMISALRDLLGEQEVDWLVSNFHVGDLPRYFSSALTKVNKTL